MIAPALTAVSTACSPWSGSSRTMTISRARFAVAVFAAASTLLVATDAEPSPGGQAVRVFPSYLAPSWPPDGRSVAYIAKTGSHADLYAVGRDGTGRRRLTNDADPSDFAPPAWSPRGDAIAFSSERKGSEGLYVVRSDGTGLSRLSTDPSLEPTWSPDATAIAYTALDFDDGRLKIFVVPAAGGTPIRISPPGEVDDLFPAWSPDGARVVFTSGKFELFDESVLDIWSMRADGSDRQRLTKTGKSLAFLRPWSPDGTQIAFLTEEAGGARIWVMNSDGNQQHPVGPLLVNDPDVFAPWSPDGRTLLYVLEQGGITTIQLLDVKSGTERRLTNRHDSEARPAWAPDGLEVAFEIHTRFPMSGRTAPSELGVAKTVGGATRKLAAVPSLRTTTGIRCELVGTEGDDVIRGTGKPEVVCGLGGDDVILGGGGGDVIDGGPGADRLLGQGGDDVLLARDGRRDFIDGGPGRDRGRLDSVDVAQGIEVRL